MCYGNIVVYLRARHQIVMSRQQKKNNNKSTEFLPYQLATQPNRSIWKIERQSVKYYFNLYENYLQTAEIYFWLRFAFWIFGTYETISDLEKKIVDFTFHSIKVFCFSVSLLIKLSATHIVHGQFYSNLKSQIRHIS